MTSRALVASLAALVLFGACSGATPETVAEPIVDDRSGKVQAHCAEVTEGIDTGGGMILPAREIVERQVEANGFSAGEVGACMSGITEARAGCEEPQLGTPAYSDFVDCVAAR